MGGLQGFSEADQEFFDQLLPVELDFTSAEDLQIQPSIPGDGMARIEVRGETDVSLEGHPLIEKDPEAQAASKLKDKGYNADHVNEAFEGLDPVLPATKARRRSLLRSD